MDPLKIKAFFDGRPGHEKQTRGILNSLQMLTDIEADIVNIKPTFKTDVSSCFSLAKAFLIPSTNQRIDLAIGTGRHTHIPVLASGKKLGARTVTCMSPSPLLVNFFDLCLVPDHDKIVHRANIIKTSGPPNLSNNIGEHNKGEGLILIGGLCSHHHWNSTEIMSMVKSITGRETRINWAISSSPRTPDDIISMIINYAENTRNCQFYSYRDTPDGWVEEHYNKCKTVWVTSDSISMVYEAITAGCRVGILPVAKRNKKNKFNLSEQNLISAKYATHYQDWHENNDFAQHDISLNEAERCARLILKKWWPERLPGKIIS